MVGGRALIFMTNSKLPYCLLDITNVNNASSMWFAVPNATWSILEESLDILLRNGLRDKDPSVGGRVQAERPQRVTNPAAKLACVVELIRIVGRPPGELFSPDCSKCRNVILELS